MEFNSILWLKTSRKSPIQKKVIENLNLEEVYQKLLSNDEILFYLCRDKETVRYRQEILSDFFKEPRLIGELMACLDRFGDLKPLYKEGHYQLSGLYRIIDIIIVMEKAILALEEMDQTLGYFKVESEGFKGLASKIKQNLDSDEFKHMKADLKEIKYLFKKIKSATLTVSMSTGLRPTFAQVTSIDDHKFRYPKAFRRVSDVLGYDPVFLDKRLTSYVPVFKVGKVNYDLLEEIEFALKEHKDMLESFVETYDRIDIRPFLNLYHEMLFYEASYRLLESLSDKKLPVSRPEIIENEAFTLKIEGGYNIHLALKEDANVPVNIVYNSITFDKERRFFIISGANRGGKTTFVQGIGQIQLLGQLGLFVPAKAVSMSLCDTIITHFPVAEKDTQDMGKFGKECEIFVEGFKRASSLSLFILNEPFAGTSHLESLSIATQGVCALMEKNVPFVFNTHLHELYDEVGQSRQGSNKQVLHSLITRMEGEKSTYELIEHEPIGKSFAREIAKKYSVTYEQLIENIRLTRE